MSFQSIDELRNFGFEDAQVFGIKVNENVLEMEIEALIVLPRNSQNSNYTESYAGTVSARFEGAKVIEMQKDGLRRYDANDVLLEEVPDEMIPMIGIAGSLKSMDEAFLPFIEELDKRDFIPVCKTAPEKVEEAAGDRKYFAEVGFEVPQFDDPSGLESTNYTLRIAYDKVIFSWEHYMNKVNK